MPHWEEAQGWARGYSARGHGRDIKSDPAWGGGDMPGWGWPLGALLTRAERNDAPMTVTLAAGGDAAGVDTLAALDVALRIIDRGAVTLALGSVKSTASARTEAGEIAFASAYSDLDIGGADIALSRTRTLTGSGTANGEAWSSQITTTNFLAVDIDGLQPLFGPIKLHQNSTGTISNAPTFQGNLATFEIDAKVFGGDTYLDVSADAVTVQDRYSTVASVVLGTADTAAGVETHAFRMGGLGSDRITTGGGDDWVFGLTGNDTIDSGSGSDTVFGGWGDDTIRTGAGHDWAFGGEGRDTIDLGEGNNLAYGGNGADRISAGGGNDAISGGGGDDVIQAGAGNNTLLLGSVGGAADGNDRYSAGGGADYYLLAGPFGNDVVTGFRIAEGDRVAGYDGDWGSAGGLRALNGGTISVQRGSDAQDLVLTLKTGWTVSTLTLDDFFALNPQHAGAPRGGAFSDDAALPILTAMVLDGDSSQAAIDRMDQFITGDLLGLLA
ncbi:calcium-binding protein [Pseudoroseomonas globiformis]|uniref:Calcium-binding protein n=1 Tax=Teichococcus globiformis TaxID=2307229 RepID=A0ABV7G1Y4_9PROT